MPIDFAPCQRAAANASLDQRFDDAALEARGQVDDLGLRQLLDAEVRLALPHVPEHRGLEPAEAEVEASVALGRVAIGIGQPRAGPANRGVVALAASRSMIGPPG